ncbi:hypothetical protein D3C80_2001260 [compost metagenome]
MPGAGGNFDDGAGPGLDQARLQVFLEVGMGNGGFGLFAAACKQGGKGQAGEQTHGGHRIIIFVIGTLVPITNL